MSIFKDQILSYGIDSFNILKQNSITKQMETIVNDTLKQKNIQNDNFEKALIHLANMRQFLSAPQHILGSQKTKHGEIAEQMEVHVRNAMAAIKGQQNVATFSGVGRTAPEDYLLNGVKTQSKFIFGLNGSLASILKHFEKYQDQTMDYIIPQDQYDIIEAIKAGGNPTNLSDKSIGVILQKVEEIERQTGRPFNSVVKHSILDFEEVQISKVQETLQGKQEEIINDNFDRVEKIEEQEKQKKSDVTFKAKPSLKEGAKVAGSAVLVSSSITACTSVYKKVKAGTKLSKFTKDDWKEVGLESATAGGKAGLAAGSIYALTNLTSLSAPFAGAVTSAMMGVTSLLVDHKKGELSLDEVVTEGQILCLEAGIAAIGGGVGQILIPIPVLGSIVGTVTTNLFWGMVKGKLGEQEDELKEIMDRYMTDLLEEVDDIYYEIMNEIDATYKKFNSLIDAAFDVDANTATLAAASIKLAKTVGVADEKIIKNEAELEAFFLD